MAEHRIFEMMYAANWWAEHNINTGDKVALITATTVDQEVTEGLRAAASGVGADVVKLMTAPQSAPGEEPPDIVGAALKEADIAISCSAESYSHTDTIINFIQSGGRHLSVYKSVDAFVDGIVEVYFNEEEFEAMREDVLTYTEALTEAETVRITTEAGTNVTGSLKDRIATPSYGVAPEQNGHSSFPTGEAHIPPVEGTTEGTVVIDTSMGGVGSIDDPITLTVEEGYVTDVEGDREAQKLRNLLDQYEHESRNFAEFGFGMNPFGTVTGDKNEDKKACGTAHIAIGDNHGFKTFAGEYDMPGGVTASLHLDSVMQDVTTYLDGEKVIDDGELLL
jgi:leucyl aminopeptidase (aminopeptidase T)